MGGHIVQTLFNARLREDGVSKQMQSTVSGGLGDFDTFNMVKNASDTFLRSEVRVQVSFK